MDRTATARTKRALASLVDADNDTTEAYADVINAATMSLDDVEAAASFLGADGSARVATAVVQAVRAGDDDAVERGRHALTTLRSFQAALTPHTRSRCAPTEATTRSAAFHFHHAHGTVLGGAGKRDDR